MPDPRHADQSLPWGIDSSLLFDGVRVLTRTLLRDIGQPHRQGVGQRASELRIGRFRSGFGRSDQRERARIGRSSSTFARPVLPSPVRTSWLVIAAKGHQSAAPARVTDALTRMRRMGGAGGRRLGEADTPRTRFGDRSNRSGGIATC